MKILAPVNSPEEAKLLLKQGALEFYCGLNPEVCLSSREQGIWLNRREPGKANLKGLEELKELVYVAHEGGAKVFLALNQPGYAAEVQKTMLELLQRLQESCRVDAYIVADPGLIMLLRGAFPDISIHVSSLAAVLNSAAVAFFKRLGVKRIIFPRYVPLEIMRTIIENSEKWAEEKSLLLEGEPLEYEAFIFNDGCVFEEGYCFVSHGFGGAFCHNPPWRYKPVKVNDDGKAGEGKGWLDSLKGGKLKAGKESFSDHLEEYKRWLWIGIKNFGGMTGTKGYPLGMCGLCALAQLKAMGVSSLKIVGREAPLKKKVESVKLVKEVLAYLEEGHSEEEVIKFAKYLRGAKGLCESGYMCYYR